jgi:hypothetical protein
MKKLGHREHLLSSTGAKYYRAISLRDVIRN